jgi:phosphoribosylformylglycinamidine synthase
MPHPERNIFFTQQDDWTMQKELLRRKGKILPTESDGIRIFKNAVEYFK